jgi:hypothetical protein
MNLPHERIHPDLGMGVGIDRANRDVRNSTHPYRKHIDPHGNEIEQLGRETVLDTGNERSEFPGDFLRGDQGTVL